MQKLYKKLILLVAIIIPLVVIVGTKAAASTQSFVETKANVLSSDQIRQLNSKLNTFAQSTINGEQANSQFAIKIIDSTDNESIEDYSKDLFNKMAIGDKKHNLGILLVVALDDQKFRIQLGDGWENTNLNETYIESYVFTDDVEYQFREGNYYEGITSIVQSTMQLAGTTVKIPASLNINSTEMSNQIKTDQTLAITFIKVMIAAVIIAAIVGLLSKIRKHFWSKYLDRMKIRVKNLIKNNEPEFNNYPKADIQLIKSDSVKQSLNILKHYNIDTLSDEYVIYWYYQYNYDKPSIWEIISKKADKKPLQALDSFLNEKAQIELSAIDKAKKIQQIKSLLNKTPYNWALDSNEFPNYFLKTKLDINIKNLKLVSDNLHNTKKILSKQENADDYDIDQQALDLTLRNPTTIYDSSLLYNLAAYSLLSNSYRSESWLDSQSYGSDSSSFSDFGGGGFSSGGGASGGW